MNILKAFDTVGASEAGSWLHLTIPGTDELAYADDKKTKPLRIKLKGPDSEAWTAFHRKAMKTRDKKDTRTAREVALEDAKLFANMTIEWENIPDDTGKGNRELTTETAVKLYLDYKDIRMQALKFVMSQENFTGTQLEA